MPDEEKQKVALKTKDMVQIIAAKNGPLVPGGNPEVRIFPSIDFLPLEDEKEFKKKASISVKITGVIKQDPTNGYTHLVRLRALKEILSAYPDLKSLRENVDEIRKRSTAVFEKNMAIILERQRSIERTYRELDGFFAQARRSPGEELENVFIINASPERNFDELMSAEAELHRKLGGVEGNFDLQKLTGLVVLSEWPGSEKRLIDFGKLADRCMAHLFVGFPDMSYKEAVEMFANGGEYQDLKSSDEMAKQCISVAGNYVRMRLANDYEKKAGMEDLYINPVCLLAGKVYQGDLTDGIHVARSVGYGKVRLDTSGRRKLRWDLQATDQLKFRKALIPLVYGRQEALTFYGVDNLFDAEKLNDPRFDGLDQYTIKRCEVYLAKVILQFLKNNIHSPIDEKLLRDVRKSIKDYLSENTDADKREKMFSYADVTNVEDVGKQRIKVYVDVKYKPGVRKFDLLINADGKDAKMVKD